jgi:hypothetical protein
MDSYQGPLQGGGLYAADDHSPQYNGTQTGYRGPSNNVNNYAYESQTWNYGGANGVGAIGGTGRIRPQQQSRRAEIPSVGHPIVAITRFPVVNCSD